MRRPDLTYEETRVQVALERESWTQYTTVRDAAELGFWPDAYGNVDDDTSIMCPPTKFSYPRAGIAHPMHVNGVSAGADLMVFTSREGDPDTLRDQPCWGFSSDVCGWMWTTFRPQRHHGKTFDEAIRIAVGIGDQIQAHYITPEYDRETDYAAMPIRHWRELASVRIPGHEDAQQAQQLDLFEAPKPKKGLQAEQDTIKRLLQGVDTRDEDRVVALPIWIGYVPDLVSIANRERSRAYADEEGTA